MFSSDVSLPPLDVMIPKRTDDKGPFTIGETLGAFGGGMGGSYLGHRAAKYIANSKQTLEGLQNRFDLIDSDISLRSAQLHSEKKLSQEVADALNLLREARRGKAQAEFNQVIRNLYQKYTKLGLGAGMIGGYYAGGWLQHKLQGKKGHPYLLGKNTKEDKAMPITKTGRELKANSKKKNNTLRNVAIGAGIAAPTLGAAAYLYHKQKNKNVGKAADKASREAAERLRNMVNKAGKNAGAKKGFRNGLAAAFAKAKNMR